MDFSPVFCCYMIKNYLKITWFASELGVAAHMNSGAPLTTSVNGVLLPFNQPNEIQGIKD